MPRRARVEGPCACGGDERDAGRELRPSPLRPEEQRPSVRAATQASADREHCDGRRAGPTCAPGSDAEDSRHELEPGCGPASEPGERGGGLRRDRIGSRRKKPETEHGRCAGKATRVRRNRVDRSLAEVEENDRRRHETADDRHAEHFRDAARHRVAVQTRAQAWDADEDRRRRRRTRAGSPDRGADVGAQASSTSAPSARKCQRSRGLATSQASDASAPGDAGAYHGGLPADRKDVGGDVPSVAELANDPRQSEQPAEPVDAEGEERDVLPGHGEEVRETGGPEVLPYRLRQPLVLPEDDAENERTPQRRPSRVRLRARCGRAGGRRVPATPPRVPIRAPAAAHARPRGCLDARARRARRSRRSSAGRGSATRTTVSRMAPRGGERPTGSTSSTRSRSGFPRNVSRLGRHPDRPRRPRAQVPVTTSTCRPGLADLREEHALAHAHPVAARPSRARAAASNAPSAATRAVPPAAPQRREARLGRAPTEPEPPSVIQFEPARPAHAEPASNAGQWSSTTRLTGSRGRAVARPASGRSREPRRDRRPI